MTETEKATIREVYNIVKPLSDGQVRIETTLTAFIETYKIAHKETLADIEKIEKCVKDKISVRAFITTITTVSIILGIIISMLVVLRGIGIY